MHFLFPRETTEIRSLKEERSFLDQTRQVIRNSRRLNSHTIVKKLLHFVLVKVKEERKLYYVSLL